MNGESSLREIVQQRCQSAGFGPNTQLGQHFLVDKNTLEAFKDNLLNLPTIEVGAGPGQLSEAIAEKVPELVCLEIDRRYEKVLKKVFADKENVELVIGDALTYRYEKPQIVGNLPYHISEPFLQLLTRLTYTSALLIVGKTLSTNLQVGLDSDDFGQLSLLSKVFFKVQNILSLPISACWPEPRTESALLKIAPITREEARNHLPIFLVRGLFLSSSKGTLIKNCLKEGLISFREPERMTQNQARSILASLKIGQDILQKSFQQLSNLEIRELAKAIFDQGFVSQI